MDSREAVEADAVQFRAYCLLNPANFRCQKQQ